LPCASIGPLRAAIVTGAGTGIGAAVARRLGGDGYGIALVGRREEPLEAVAAELEAAVVVPADVGAAGEAERVVAAAVQRFGGVDVLVNNAGIGRFANVADMSLDDWQQIIETNLSGVFYCSRAAIPAMKARGAGFIVNISSLAGKNPFTTGAAYCASKAGLNAFSEALMQEVRHDNIRVSYVLPGSVSTGFGDRGSSGEAEWKLTPEDVARVVVDLIAHDARSLPSRVELRPSRPRKS
jgi:3-oxoacyl-[acyl-carrier protein] reductase